MPTDTERLNWLEANRKSVWVCHHCERRETTETEPRREIVEVFDGYAVNISDEPQPTPRAAIDAAMGEPKPQPQPKRNHD